MIEQTIKFYKKPEPPKPKKNFSSVDGQKLQYHPHRVAKALDSQKDWEQAKTSYPIYIEVSPLNFCNHACQFCGIDYARNHDAKIDSEVFNERVKELSEVGVKAIMFAGEGEPLLHKTISEMVEATKLSGIDVSFTTNAVPLTKKFVDKSLQHISWIKVSFNAGTPETYAKIHQTKERDFHLVVENIKYALKYRNENNLNCDIGMQMVLLDDNAHEVITFAKLAKDIGCDYAVIKKYSQQVFSNTHIYENTDYSKYLSLGKQLETLNSDSFSVVFRSNSMVESEPYQTCMSTPHLWAYVDSNLDVYACSAYLLQDRFNLGNLKDQSFKEVWQGEKRRKLFEEGIDISGCRTNCRMDACNKFLDQVANNKVPNVNFI